MIEIDVSKVSHLSLITNQFNILSIYQNLRNNSFNSIEYLSEMIIIKEKKFDFL